MIRLGVLDFDTSHATEFTARLNHKHEDETQWVHGARVVIGCAGESKLAPGRIAGFRKQMEEMGVPLVENPIDMIGKVDGMLIESLEGGVHYDRAKPFLNAGVPCFIDKPFACSAVDARRLFSLAAQKNTVVFSASSLRFAPEVIACNDQRELGELYGVVSYGPAPYIESSDSIDRNPGLFHYGIHALEVLYTLMGPGCTRLSCWHEKDVDVVTGLWSGGKLTTLRGIRSAGASYGFVAFGAKGVKHVTIDTTYIYRELLKQIVTFFEQKKSPVEPAVTIEMMAYLEAALKSARNGGACEELP